MSRTFRPGRMVFQNAFVPSCYSLYAVSSIVD
jgi:hypothetical protein